ncbi:hypothetical protein K469DRAFT_712410 [Zopfia rhizophila CBS 207.26]|uniref:Uncharacterized protein n=1 Tax=Zopfia rhizophila CBS 207.26 TaxID=1314779 RepID=A0A6A6EQS0_9PEZI|nr:hypothetical protein K469DRAFT_712410 [Zopfia rhizophila CBS 207.26]
MSGDQSSSSTASSTSNATGQQGSASTTINGEIGNGQAQDRPNNTQEHPHEAAVAVSSLRLESPGQNVDLTPFSQYPGTDRNIDQRSATENNSPATASLHPQKAEWFI